MANKYARAGGGNWSTNATWSTTDGGGADTVAPTTSDVALLTGTSGAVTVDTTTCVCQTLNMSNYASTLTFTSGQKLTVSGTANNTLAGTLAGTGTLTNTGASIWNGSPTSSSGVLLTSSADIQIGTGSACLWGTFTQTGGVLKLQSGNLYVSGNVSLNQAIYNNFSLYVGGSLTSASGTISQSGTPTIVMNGTGSIASINIGCGITINTAGTITFGSNVRFGTNVNTFTYTAGTVDTTAGPVAVFGSYGFNSSGMRFNSINISGSPTITLGSDLKATTLTMSSGSTMTISGAYGIDATTMIIPATCVLTMVNNTTLTSTNLYITGHGATMATLTTGAGNTIYVAFQGTDNTYILAYASLNRIIFTGRKMYNWWGTNTTVTNCDVVATNTPRLVMPQLVGV